MKGDAITAGSKPSRLASMGSRQPTSLAMTMVAKMVRATTKAIKMLFWSMIITLKKTTIPRVAAHSIPTRASFQTTWNTSENSMSPRDMARITVTDA